MERINVIGTSGSGKSTLSKQLAAQLEYPYHEIDALFWKPNWTQTPDSELLDKIADITHQPYWVLDGNYSRTEPVKWQHVDTIIWVDYSFPRTFYQALKRALSRWLSGKELWPGTGNKETLGNLLLSKDSILLWTLRNYAKNRRRYSALMQSPDYPHIRFVRLRSPAETQAFLNAVQPDQHADNKDASCSL